jgi:hypothetical protein
MKKHVNKKEYNMRKHLPQLILLFSLLSGVSVAAPSDPPPPTPPPPGVPISDLVYPLLLSAILLGIYTSKKYIIKKTSL